MVKLGPSRLLTKTTILFALLGTVLSATPDQWRTRSIYQLLTDRFARTDGSTTASCPLGYEGFCGGTWQGIINKLPYIKVCHYFTGGRPKATSKPTNVG